LEADELGPVGGRVGWCDRIGFWYYKDFHQFLEFEFAFLHAFNSKVSYSH
jgi:hypothetical protein